GVTVYRDGSKYGQVLNVDSSKEENKIIKPSNYSKALLKKLYESNSRLATLLDIQKILEADGLNKSLDSFVNNESKENQGNEKGKQQARQAKEIKKTDEIRDNEERCPVCGSKLTSESGCKVCHNCGWSACTVG
ncbi:MAG: ribonucleoside-diphosphate reductase alpha chain, partial [Candidatus Woesearchaeota archaeon]|nr:ribonucleoside-diphosphate reductase alpha chain [Candidatus Woesearchaeota archaeon]